MSNENNTIAVDMETWTILLDERDRFMIALQEIAKMSCCQSLLLPASIAIKALKGE